MLSLRSHNRRAKYPVFAKPGHIDYETLGLYVLGDLSVRATAAAEEHLSSCARCKSSLPQVQAVIAALRTPIN
jgi:anti-sigma factor RsiW